MKQVAILFTRADSIYKTLPGTDCYDIERDALTWPGGCSVVAHPPCRGWGRLRHFAKPVPGELDLGPWAVNQVRRYGGVMEHPAYSRLWPACGLPHPGTRDDFGGWTLPISQHWWGHRAQKMTWVYVVGCNPADMPRIPLLLGDATHVIAQSRPRRADGTRLRKKSGDPAITGWRPEVTYAEREHTPRQLAEWFIETARRCYVPHREGNE